MGEVLEDDDAAGAGVLELVLEFPGRPPAFPGCPGLVQAWEVGRRLELVIVNFGAEQRRVVEALAPLSWDVVGLNLEDAFVALTGEEIE